MRFRSYRCWRLLKAPETLEEKNVQRHPARADASLAPWWWHSGGKDQNWRSKQPVRQSSLSWSKVCAHRPPSPPGCASVGQYRRYIHHPAEKRYRSVSAARPFRPGRGEGQSVMPWVPAKTDKRSVRSICRCISPVGERRHSANRAVKSRERRTEGLPVFVYQNKSHLPAHPPCIWLIQQRNLQSLDFTVLKYRAYYKIIIIIK